MPQLYTLIIECSRSVTISKYLTKVHTLHYTNYTSMFSCIHIYPTFTKEDLKSSNNIYVMLHFIVVSKIIELYIFIYDTLSFYIIQHINNMIYLLAVANITGIDIFVVDTYVMKHFIIQSTRTLEHAYRLVHRKHAV